MFIARCCRTCLTTEGLHRIFHVAELKEKYTNAIYLTTGLKVEPNDSLPQQMCAVCINFINDMLKFRKKCHNNNNILNARLSNIQITETKYEDIKEDPPIYIDIEDHTSDIGIEDYNDVLHEPSVDETDFENVPKVIEFESRVEQSDLEDVPLKELMKNRKLKKKIINKRRVKKQVKTKELENENRNVMQEDITEFGNENDRVKQNIECEHCHKILTSKLSLRNHYKIHTGFDVVCEHCGKKFITRRLLLMHCRAKHGYEKTDKCSYCDYRASNAEQVKIHERIHTGEKPYVCAECGRGFHRNSSYLQHVAIHLPEKTVVCDECPARFKSVTLMKIHKTRHRRPQYAFKCLVCNNTFARRRNVARHLLMIHGTQPTPQHIDKVHIT